MGTTKQKAICILGMHRSGTSAVARAINLLGAYVGREDQLMPAREDNPDGFWEHMSIYFFHERFLKTLFRSWDSVWPLPDGWWKKPEIEPYRRELKDLIRREFEGRPLWMWKDPRTSLFLPLWKEVLQELEIDVFYPLCIRNPLDVAASLTRREGFSKCKSLTLWHLHNVSSCHWTEGCRRAVVHYDDLLEDWEPSLRRIAAFLQIPWPLEDNPLRNAMAALLKPGNRHSHSDFRSLKEDRDVPEEVISLYRLLLESQENPGLLDSEEAREYISKSYTGYSTFFNMMYSKEWGIIETTNTLILEEKIKKKEEAFVKLNQAFETGLRDKESHIGNLERHIGNLEAAARKKETLVADPELPIGNFEAVLREKDSRIELLQKTVESKEATLNYIYFTYGLGALWVCNRMVDKLFPHNTRRRLFASVLINTIKNPMAALKSLNRRNIKLFIQYLRTTEPAILAERAETIIFKEAVLMYCDKVMFEPEHIEIVGWAISSQGIKKVEVFCDGQLLGQASYGLRRADIHAVYPFVANSLNSGFHFTAVLENTLSAGHHTLLTKAVANDGKTTETTYPTDVVDAYTRYLARNAPTVRTLRWMRGASKHFPVKPRVMLVLVVKEETFPFLYRSLESIRSQVYPFWRMMLLYDNEPLRDRISGFTPLVNEGQIEIHSIKESVESIKGSRADFIGFLRSGDLLEPHALFEMVKGLNEDESLDLIYSDEDTFINGQRKDFFCKPDWSPDLFLSMNYIGQFFLLRKHIFEQMVGLDYGFSAEGMYDLLLKVTEKTSQIGHVPSVLYTKGSRLEDSSQAGEQILEQALSRRGTEGNVICLGREGTYRVKRDIIGNPKVSIIIPTAYKKPEFLEGCLKSVAEKSTYINYEVVLIDHSHGNLSEKEIERLLPTRALRVVNYEGEFNFSRMNNVAAKETTGDYLVFLNDDAEVISSEWMEAMLEQAQRTEVGVVGAKLLYRDNTIQHAGVFLVNHSGVVRHAFRFLPNDSGSYWGFADVTRNCSAVTFACAMVSKEKFSKLAGLDENLRVEWNDIDFCLRAIEAGFLIVWTPFSLLYHEEFGSREMVNVWSDTTYFLKRWRSFLKRGDPYYNRNLTLNSGGFSLHGVADDLRKPVGDEAKEESDSIDRTSKPYPSGPEPMQETRLMPSGQIEEDIRIESDSHVSVIIPTFNGSKELTVLLPKLMAQKGLKSLEIIIIDSGSKDDTVEVCKKNGAKVIEISQQDFSHSYARNLGAKNATKDYFLFMVQDALPSSALFVYRILHSLKKHSAVAASCGEFLRMDADLFAEVEQTGHYRFLDMGDSDKVLSLPEKEDYVSMRKSSQLTDISCLIERNVFLRYGYRNDYAEDLDLALRLIKDKYRLVYVNTTKVIHSHTRPAYYILKRSLVDNISIARLFPDFPKAGVDCLMFCEDILFMYRLIEEIVSEVLVDFEVPYRTSVLRDKVMDYLDQGSTNRYPMKTTIRKSSYVDGEFIGFVKTINKYYDRKSVERIYSGKLLADVKYRMSKVFDYLQGTSETIDDHRREDIVSCFYKTLAIAIGTELAFYDGQENPRRVEFIIDLKKELARGV